MTTFHGTKHDDTFDESSDTTSDTFDLYKGGNDTVKAGSGDDRFNLGASLNAGDRLDGGDGKDVLLLNGDYSAGVTFNDLTIQNIEVLRLAKGFSYNLTLADGNVIQSQYLTINAGALAAGQTLTFDGSKVSHGHLTVVGGAGDDTITGGAKGDVFNLQKGGNDTAHGGGGNDVFSLGAAFTSADIIDGGAGNDTLVLNGDYSSLTLASGQLTSVDKLILQGGHDYGIGGASDTVAAGETMIVDFSTTTSSDSVAFLGGTAAGNFDFIAGKASVIHLAGGTGNDIFDLTGAGTATVGISGNDGNDTFLVGANFKNLSIATFTGNAGNDTVEFNGDYTGANAVTFTAGFTGMETLKLDNGFSYSLTTNDANVATGATMSVDASALTGTNALTFNGSAENGGFYAVTGGAGDDTVTFGSHFTASYSFNGGAGNDTLHLNANGIFTFGATTLTNVEDLIVSSAGTFRLTTNDATVASGATLTVDYSPLNFIAGDYQFDGSAETNGHFNIIAPASADLYVATGGALSDTFTLGNDGTPTNIITGGGGDDTLTMSAPNQVGFQFDGGANSDTLAFTGGGTVDGSTSRFTNVETVSLDDHAWSVTTRDFNVSAGATLLVDGTALSSHALSFNGSDETDGSFGLKGGVGDDTLIGGGLADDFLGGYGADKLTGGGGADTFFYGLPITSSSTAHDTITDFAAGTDKIDLQAIVTGIFSVSGSINSANFDSDLAALHPIQAQGATIVTVTGGDLNGHTLLVIDGNGDDIYTPGFDYVIDVTGYTGTITTGDFI